MNYIYFVKANGLIKIGTTVNIGSRINHLRYKSNNNNFELLASIATADRALEKKLHKRFSEYRVHGEWFEPRDELLAYVRELTAKAVVGGLLAIHEPLTVDDIDTADRIYLESANKKYITLDERMFISALNKFYRFSLVDRLERNDPELLDAILAHPGFCDRLAERRKKAGRHLKVQARE